MQDVVEPYETWLRRQVETSVAGASALSGSLDRQTALWLSRFVDDLPDLLGEEMTPALVHGDFWPENMLKRQSRLVGVLDWEAAAIGDASVDLAGFGI